MCCVPEAPKDAFQSELVAEPSAVELSQTVDRLRKDVVAIGHVSLPLGTPLRQF